MTGAPGSAEKPHVLPSRKVPPVPSPLAALIHRMLTSGPVMRVKRLVRDAFWALRDRAYQNPPWPGRVNSMLFVCYGNICRSPFAARLADQRLISAGLTGVRCSSAGFRANQRNTSPLDAVDAAAPYGVRLGDNRPLLLTQQTILAHDVVFVMEPGHLKELRRRWPAQRHRFFLLPRFETPAPEVGAYERTHFEDPFDRGPDAFLESYARISRAIDGVVRQWRRGGQA